MYDRFSLRNVGSNLFMGVYNPSAGANVYQYAQSFYADQDFTLMGSNGTPNTFKIVMTNLPSMFINVQKSGGVTYNGANVFVDSSRPVLQQYWTFTLDAVSGYYIIQPYGYSSLALTAYGNSPGTSSGTTSTSPGNIFVSTFSSGNNYQLWELVPISSS